MINILKSLKLVRYSNNFITNILLYIAFTGFGVYLMLTTENTTLSCALLMLGPCLLSNIFVDMSRHESIAVSPLGRLLKRTIPNIILSVSSVFTYIFLIWMIELRSNKQSDFYSIYTEHDAGKLFCYGFWIILLAVILYPILSSNLVKGVGIMILCFVPIMILSVPFFELVYEGPDYDKEYFDYNDTVFLANIILLISYLVTFIWKPFAASAEKNSKRVNLIRYVVAFGIIAAIAIIIIAINKNQKTPSVDGIYDYSHLHKQYAKLAEKNPNPKLIECYGAKSYMGIEIKEYYYNPDTFDAYCVLKITLGESSLIEIEMLKDYSGIRIHETDKSKYADVDYAAVDEIYFETDHEITTNCNSIIDMEYKISSVAPNVAEVKLLINAVPQSDSIPENNTLSLICGDFSVAVAIPTTNKNDTYKSDGNEILISPVSMVHKESLPATDITLKMKNGKDVVIMSDGILTDGVEKHQNNYLTKYIFYNTIDPEKIEDVIVENNGDAYEPDYDKIFALAENSHMRKTVYYGTTENKNVDTATITIEWLQEPDNKYLDYIQIDAYTTIKDLKVTQNAKNSTNDEWISFTLPSANEEDDIITNSYSLRNYATRGKYDSINIYNTFFEDTSSEKYTNHTISITIDYYSYRGNFDYIPINCIYYHMLTSNNDEEFFQTHLNSTKCGKIGRAFMAY